MPVRTPRCRPRLEALEDRWLPAQGTTIFWTSPIDGDWNSGENWSGGQVPGALDDVVIGSGVVVTHSGNLNTAKSLVCDGGLVVSGGLLALGQPSTIAALSVSGGFFRAVAGVSVTQSFDWTGGQLAGTNANLFGVASISGESDKTLNGFHLDNHADLVWSGGAIFSDGGEFNNLSDGAVRVTGGTYLGAPFTNAGRLVVAVPGVVLFSSIDTSGDVTLQSGDLQAATFVQSAGQTQLQGATLEVELCELQGGSLTGWGVIAGNVENHGRVGPIGGTLYVQGDFDQASDGVLTLLVGDPEAVPLLIDGQAFLAGTLEAQLDPNAQPVAGAVSVGLTSAQRQGQFDNVFTWSDDRSGWRLTPIYSDTNVNLLVESFAAPSVPQPPTAPPAPPVPSPPVASPVDSTPTTQTPTVKRTTSTTSDPTLVNANRPVDLGGANGLAGTQGPAGAAPGSEPGGQATPGGGRGAPQGPPQGPPNGGGGRLGEAGGRPADPAAQLGGRAPTIGGPMGGRMGAADQTESSGLADELFATFPLALPEIELPSANELLSTADVAAALVVGVRPRANLVPQQSGSQLSGVATLMASEEPGEREADLSPFAGLFVSPLTGLGQLADPDAVSRADREPADRQDAEPRRPVAGVALMTVLAAGAAWVGSVRQSAIRRKALS